MKFFVEEFLGTLFSWVLVIIFGPGVIFLAGWRKIFPAETPERLRERLLREGLIVFFVTLGFYVCLNVFLGAIAKWV